MAMQNMRESLLSAPQIPWWNAFGSQPLAPASLAGDSDSFPVGYAGETEHGGDKQSNSASHLAFSLGDVKNSRDVTKPHGSAFSMKPPLLGTWIFSATAYGSQSRVMLPLNMETEDGTIYVNSKQYHGITRRRQSRAKAASVLHHNKLSSRGRKPYMHHSRHLHALRRPRGSGGRFLNTKSQKADDTKQTQSQPQKSNSQNSEVIHLEGQIMNLSHGLNVSVSEVTSMNYFLTAAMDNGCLDFNT
ncbi:unnamed protein product [Brassica oleracea var. botrytis]